MIVERGLINLVTAQTQNTDLTWTDWTPDAQSINIQRGGSLSGAATTVDVGTMSLTLLNAGDPLLGGALKPFIPIRLMTLPVGSIAAVPIFTGFINDLATVYTLDKGTGILSTNVNISAVDAVSQHAATVRYGAVSSSGLGFETWANRIIRLATSSTMPINDPADGSPIVRYAL